MIDERTDEQKEADTALEQAIRKCADAHFPGGFVTEFAVCAHQIAPAQDGTGDDDNMLILLPNGGHDMPSYRVIGLLETCRLHVEAECLSPDGDE